MASDRQAAKKAHAAIRRALIAGQLHRPDVCEVCGCPMRERNALRSRYGVNTAQLRGHHWRGYDRPLDVWWICPSCNYALRGRHDGSLSLTEARSIIEPYSLERERAWLEHIRPLLVSDNHHNPARSAPARPGGERIDDEARHTPTAYP